MHCSRLPPPTSRPPACALLRWQQKTLGSSVWNALQDSATPRGRGPEAQAAAMVEWGVWGCPRCEARPGSGWGSAAGQAQGLGRRSLQTGGRGALEETFITPPGWATPLPQGGGAPGSAPWGARPGLRPRGGPGRPPPPPPPPRAPGGLLQASSVLRGGGGGRSLRLRGTSGPRGGEGLNAKSEEDGFY